MMVTPFNPINLSKAGAKGVAEFPVELLRGTACSLPGLQKMLGCGCEMIISKKSNADFC
jgi:hypothetical protein